MSMRRTFSERILPMVSVMGIPKTIESLGKGIGFHKTSCRCPVSPKQLRCKALEFKRTYSAVK